jgi:3-phenylpropionate/cinnamic acid dioxygenase small subunit
VTLLAEVQQLLFRQCHLIDSGDAAGWAATYLPDGVFDSPTYDRPVTGSEELRDFAHRVHTASPRLRHVLTNVYVVDQPRPDECATVATLLIVTATDDGVRIDRVTTVHDHLVRRDDAWLMARRRVVPA